MEIVQNIGNLIASAESIENFCALVGVALVCWRVVVDFIIVFTPIIV